MSEVVNDVVALSSALGRGEEDIAWKSMVGGGVCDLREAVKDAASEIRSDVQTVKSDIRESLQNAQIQNTQQFAHVHEKACDAEKEAIRAQYEGKLQTIQTGKEVENRVSDFERNADSRFTELEKSVLREHCTTRDLVREQGERTREKVEECCCETKERLALLSKEHVQQLLAEAKDELQEERFRNVVAKLSPTV